MHCFKRNLLAAATVVFILTLAFPAFAGEPVGTDVTVVETGTSDTSEDTAQGPGVQKVEQEETQAPGETSLGQFTITGYCGCEQCSGGHNLTYSGTVPTPNHTISADLSHFPLGTKLKIDGTVYTVEDKGSSVNGNILDIFYGSHQEALAKGTYTAEVFLVEN